MGDDSPSETRRRWLVGVAAGVASLAGCNDASDNASNGSTPTEGATATDSPTPTESATVTESPPPTDTPTPSAAITDLSVEPNPVGQFQPVTVRVTVTNDGTAPFEGFVTVTETPGDGASNTDETAVEVASLTVAPGERVTRTGESTLGRVGDHQFTASLERRDGPTVARRTTTAAVEVRPSHPVTVVGPRLQCNGKSVMYGGGSLANAFAPENNRPSEASLEPAFDTLAGLGVSSARIWGFAPSWADISSMPGPNTFNDRWFDYFDRVVVAAKKRGIRLFVPLINGNPAYGPVTEDRLSVNVPQFVRWADDAETRNDFFDSEACFQLYKRWVTRLVTHENRLTGVEYRNDPTIAMWELGNEIQRSPPQVGRSIRPWIERAGRFVKTLDDQTLLTTGSYGHQGRNAFIEEARADPIDVVSIHYYPGPEHYDLPESDVVATLESTIETVRTEIGKPLYVGEYNWGVGPNDSAPYTERTRWVTRLQRVMRANRVAATNFHTIADENRPTSYHKKATVYAPNERGTLDAIATHARKTRKLSASDCV